MKQEKVIDAIINNDEIGVIMDENPNNAISEKFTPNNKEVCIQKSRAIPVEIKKIDSNAIIPTRGTSESAGAD